MKRPERPGAKGQGKISPIVFSDLLILKNDDQSIY